MSRKPMTPEQLEKRHAESRQYYATHKAEKSAYYQANKARIDAVNRLRLKRNGRSVAARQRAYFLANKQRCYEMARAWKRANPEKVSQIARRSHLRDRYGLTMAEYDAMVAAQNGTCATCPTKDGQSCGASFRLGVDHDHAVSLKHKSIRGLLCHRCNSVLGLAKDDPDVLWRLLAYLEIWRLKGRAS